jgi:hypothetical protein
LPAKVPSYFEEGIVRRIWVMMALAKLKLCSQQGRMPQMICFDLGLVVVLSGVQPVAEKFECSPETSDIFASTCSYA